MLASVNILILNFARPLETELCLRSIKKNCLFPYEVFLLNNGNHDQEKIRELKNEGLIDTLIESTENLGGGPGTIRLFEASNSEFSLWIESDCTIKSTITQNDMDFWIEFLRNSEGNIKCIDLTGGICGKNIYSGRAFFINTEFYNSIPKYEIGGNGEKLYGGPGKTNQIKYLEQFVQEFFKENNFNVAQIPVIGDNGWQSIRENPDSSLWRHEPDTKKLWLIRGPVKEKFVYPKFTETEWTEVLESQTWPPGQIPENERADSFTVSAWH